MEWCQPPVSLTTPFIAASSLRQTTSIMVMKQAVPPMSSDMGSDRNTPVVPSAPILGSSITRGRTRTTFLKMEKNTAHLDLASARKMVWPVYCSAMKKKPIKKSFIAGIPAWNTAGSSSKILMKKAGKP